MKAKPVTKSFAKKSLGQNFLADQSYIDRIVAALNVEPQDTIIEIGPGRGALTEKIVEKAGRVIALELDRDLVPLLQEKFSNCNNFLLIESDALAVNFKELLISSNPQSAIRITQSKLVANLPYYISTAILQRLIEQRECFSEMVLMFQREVVERITAQPGNSDRGFLTVLVENAFEVVMLFDVPPSAFRPSPKVWSSVVRLVPKKAEIENERLFREIVSAGFAQKRKTLLNNLKNAPEELKEIIGNAERLLKDCQIDSKRRAETLTLVEWKRILEAVAKKNRS